MTEESTTTLRSTLHSAPNRKSWAGRPRIPLNPKAAARMASMPLSYRADYKRAATGRSIRAAINAMCRECFGWENVSENIRGCTDPACPLYNYRPYQKND